MSPASDDGQAFNCARVPEADIDVPSRGKRRGTVGACRDVAGCQAEELGMSLSVTRYAQWMLDAIFSSDEARAPDTRTVNSFSSK